jgi:hypothetical protein
MSEAEKSDGGGGDGGDPGTLSRGLSENATWNKRNSSNMVLDANIENDSSTTPRTEPPKSHWQPHHMIDSFTISPQLSQKSEILNNISRQVSFQIEQKNEQQKEPPQQQQQQQQQQQSMKKFQLSSSSDSKKMNQNENNENSDDKEMFEIEKQLKRLHHSINSSKQKEHNSYIQQKPFYFRLLSCHYFFKQPTKCSLEIIYQQSKTCDLFFQRKGYEFEGDLLSKDILRGVKSTLNGKYLPKSCHLNLWNHVGIIITITNKQITSKIPSPRGNGGGGGESERTHPSATTGAAGSTGAPTGRHGHGSAGHGSSGHSVDISSHTPSLSLFIDQPTQQQQPSQTTHRKSLFFSKGVTPEKEILTKYLLVANEKGISLRNFHEILATCDVILKGSLPTGRYVAAFRPIRVTKLGIPQYCHMCEYLEEIARHALAAGGLLLWRDLFTIYQHLLVTNPMTPPPPAAAVAAAETVIDATDPPLLPSLPSYLTEFSLASFNFLPLFFSRLSSVSYRPSNESIAEAIRCFHLIATSHLSDFTDPTEFEQKNKTNSGKSLFRSKSQFEVISVESLREGLRGILRIPSAQTKGDDPQASSQPKESTNLSPMSPKESQGEGNVVDNESTHHLERLLNAFEADTAKDGMISLVTQAPSPPFSFPSLSSIFLSPL